MDEIRVRVVEFGDRQHYQMQHRDPMSGRKKTKSTGVERTGRPTERKEAARVAAKWEAELREGRYHQPNRITWEDFRERYAAEVVTGMKDTTTARKVEGVFNSVGRILKPARLRNLNADRLSYYRAVLRNDGRSEATIKSHLAHLLAALSWAVELGMLPKVPRVKAPPRGKQQQMMKGRPIAREEFERMLAKVEVGLLATKPNKKRRPKSDRRFSPEALPRFRKSRAERAAAVAPSWRHFLEGLWWSGLRLGESLEL